MRHRTITGHSDVHAVGLVPSLGFYVASPHCPATAPRGQLGESLLLIRKDPSSLWKCPFSPRQSELILSAFSPVSHCTVALLWGVCIRDWKPIDPTYFWFHCHTQGLPGSLWTAMCSVSGFCIRASLLHLCYLPASSLFVRIQIRFAQP